MFFPSVIPTILRFRLPHQFGVALTILVCFFALSAKETGCKRNKTTLTASPATTTRSADFLVNKLKKRTMADVRTLTARAKISMQGNGQSMEVNANVIWIRDSVLWLNVKKFGIEGARALITPDSVFLLNRLDKTYTAKGLESLQHQYNLPAGFPLLQSFILGTAWLEPGISLKSDIKNQLHHLSGSSGVISAEYLIEEGSFLLRQEMFLQPKDARTVALDFSDYQNITIAGAFPVSRHIEAYSPETGAVSIDLQLSEVEFNTNPTYRFEVPDHYERKN